MMFGLSKYLIGGAGIALALSLAWGLRVDHLRAGWKSKYEAASVQAGKVLASIRLASDNPKLAWREASEQVALIGESRKAWKGTAELQSSRIDEMAAESMRLKALNAELRAKADKAIAKRETAIRKLQSGVLDAGDRANCAQQLFEAEKALDLVYQEGL